MYDDLNTELRLMDTRFKSARGATTTEVVAFLFARWLICASQVIHEHEQALQQAAAAERAQLIKRDGYTEAELKALEQSREATRQKMKKLAMVGR